MSIALVVIDVQKAFEDIDASGAVRSCQDAGQNIATLLSAFRNSGKQVVHVHHHANDEQDPFYGSGSGAAPQDIATPLPGEPVFIKHTSSAFVATGLDEKLKELGTTKLVLTGAAANYCVDSTARSAGDLGYDVEYVGDAVWTYGEAGPDGTEFDGRILHDASMANIHGEFGTVVKTADVLKGI